MQHTHNIVATLGKYKDKNGAEKNRYHTIGKAFTREDGSVVLKLDSIPAGNDWTGWLALFTADRDQSPQQQPQRQHQQQYSNRPAQPRQQAPARQQYDAADYDDGNDDIPF